MKTSSDPKEQDRKATPQGRTRLVEVIRSIHFGRIENLLVRNGEPVFGRDETIVREVKFGGDNGGTACGADLASLSDKTTEMFGHFDTLGDCLVRFIEVKHGKPFKMNVVTARPEDKTNQYPMHMTHRGAEVGTGAPQHGTAEPPPQMRTEGRDGRHH